MSGYIVYSFQDESVASQESGRNDERSKYVQALFAQRSLPDGSFFRSSLCLGCGNEMLLKLDLPPKDECRLLLRRVKGQEMVMIFNLFSFSNILRKYMYVLSISFRIQGR